MIINQDIFRALWHAADDIERRFLALPLLVKMTPQGWTERAYSLNELHELLHYKKSSHSRRRLIEMIEKYEKEGVIQRHPPGDQPAQFFHFCYLVGSDPRSLPSDPGSPEAVEGSDRGSPPSDPASPLPSDPGSPPNQADQPDSTPKPAGVVTGDHPLTHAHGSDQINKDQDQLIDKDQIDQAAAVKVAINAYEKKWPITQTVADAINDWLKEYTPTELVIAITAAANRNERINKPTAYIDAALANNRKKQPQKITAAAADQPIPPDNKKFIPGLTFCDGTPLPPEGVEAMKRMKEKGGLFNVLRSQTSNQPAV